MTESTDARAGQPVPATLIEISGRLDAGDDRMGRIEAAQKDMRAELRANSEMTSDIRDVLAATRMGFKVIGWLGAGAKWLGMLAAAAVAIYTAFYAALHGGATPK
jgi:hypothetical protein